MFLAASKVAVTTWIHWSVTKSGIGTHYTSTDLTQGEIHSTTYEEFLPIEPNIKTLGFTFS